MIFLCFGLLSDSLQRFLRPIGPALVFIRANQMIAARHYIGLEELQLVGKRLVLRQRWRLQ